MTTHDRITETTPSPEEAQPATARTELQQEHASSSTVAADPSPVQTESTVSAGKPSAVATDAVTNPTVGRAFRTVNSSVRIGDRGYRGAGWDDGSYDGTDRITN